MHVVSFSRNSIAIPTILNAWYWIHFEENSGSIMKPFGGEGMNEDCLTWSSPIVEGSLKVTDLDSRFHSLTFGSPLRDNDVNLVPFSLNCLRRDWSRFPCSHPPAIWVAWMRHHSKDASLKVIFHILYNKLCLQTTPTQVHLESHCLNHLVYHKGNKGLACMNMESVKH